MKRLNLPKFLFFVLLLLLFSSIGPGDALAYTTTYHPISISSISNGFIWNAYPHIPLGDHTVLGSVPFNLPTKESNQRSYLDMDSSLFPTHPSEGIITLNITSPRTVYLLLASGNSFINFEGQKIGEIILGFGDSSTFSTDLALGENIREWCQRNSGTVNTLNDPNAQSVWSDSCPGSGTGNLDMLTITPPENFRNKILQSVKVDDTSLETVNSYNPAVNWYGLTISSESPSPLILLPGFGASWNYANMILGIEKPVTDWYLAPWVKTYNGLLQAFQNAGYNPEGPNQNFYVFNYNWTKPVDTSANDLKSYIDNIVAPPENTKVDLVGHSMGGLIARTYVQNNPSHPVDDLITVGPPHKGVVKTYYAWEGAELSSALSPWQTIPAGILLNLRKNHPETNVHAIQRLSPSLKDLLPIFNYLRKGSLAKPLSEMHERNIWLENLNNPPIPTFLTEVTHNIVGRGKNTLEWIMVGHRNQLDELLGKWADGKPVGQVWGDGDQTVLTDSAQLNNAHIIELNDINHTELVTSSAGQEAILDLLGFPSPEISPSPTVSYENSLVFQLASPATLAVFGPGGWETGAETTNNIPDATYSPDDKLIVIPNPIAGEYQAQVSQEGDGGDFQLLIGKLFPENDIWQIYQGQTSEEPQIFSTPYTPDPQANKLELLILAKEKLESVEELLSASQSRFKTLLVSLIKFRIRQIERIITLLQEGKDNLVQKQIQRTIISLSRLERNLDRWQKLMQLPQNLVSDIREGLGIVSDYLSQAYSL